MAPLGTALTPDQATLLRRFAPAAMLLYDSDQAGLRATFRAGDELLRHGVRVKVATMPAGEDPDTLVRRGGAAALEPLLGDAMDLLERKIQLLEQKGWFEGVDHRRDALDRLLPTIRAAADPVTRELYLSVTAERTGVSKEVLEREARGGASDARAEVERTRAPVRTASGVIPQGARRHVLSTPETQLVQALLVSPSLGERAALEVAPEFFERLELREIYLALLKDPEAASQLPASLTDAAQAAWSATQGVRGRRRRRRSGGELRPGGADPDRPTGVPKDDRDEGRGRKTTSARRVAPTLPGGRPVVSVEEAQAAGRVTHAR